MSKVVKYPSIKILKGYYCMYLTLSHNIAQSINEKNMFSCSIVQNLAEKIRACKLLYAFYYMIFLQYCKN